MGQGTGEPVAKILTIERLLALRRQARADGRKVVQCHGCFDIVHPGHIRHLRQAKALGDILLVTLSGDSAIDKGPGRPLIPEELRAENLAALDCVDWVHVEPGPTAAELLERVRPDVYVKGREYEFNKDPRFRAERGAVERHGGRVVFSSGDVVFSSTALISAIEHSVDPFQARLAQLMRTEELSGPALFDILSAFRARRLLVVGETILDTYVLCDRPDIAGESPVMTLRPVERRHYDGGAAIIARHAAALGARPVLVTALPRSEQGELIRRRLIAEGVEVRALPIDRPLPEKQRFLVGTQKVMKVDLVERLVLDAGRQDELAGMVEDAAREGGGGGAGVIADFGQGLLTPGLLLRLCKSARRRTGVLSGDVSGRRAGLRAMRGLDLLCPSETELRESYSAFDEGLATVTWRLLEETRAGSAIVTMGAEGLIAFDRLPQRPADRCADAYASRLSGEHIPALAPFAVDALGCGDAMITAATLALASGASLLAAGFLGAVAAAAQAQRIGNLPVSATDIRQGVMRVHAAQMAYAAPDVIASRAAHAHPHPKPPAAMTA